MKNLFDTARVEEVKNRIGRLTPASQHEWGTMTVAQALAHCSLGMESAFGVQKPPRVLVGRILGPVIKPLALKDDAPMRKNSPTSPAFIVQGEPGFSAEQARLNGWVERFGAEGPSRCTDHPHAFFGRLEPDEWAILMYKHVDHHLRQFGV